MIDILPNIRPAFPHHGSLTPMWPVSPKALWKIFGTACLALLLLPSSRTAAGQALPAAEASPISTGFQLPRVAGSLRYSISATGTLSSGYYSSGISTAAGLSGDLAYISPSKIYPFSAVFSGGRYWSISGQPPTSYFNLGLSQVITTRSASIILSDAVSYLPQTPSTGISGIPGTGDLGIPPIQVGADGGQGVLTDYANRVSNIASITGQQRITGKTSVQASGSYTILRFLGNSTQNLDSNNEAGNAGMSHTIDARNTISAGFGYSRYSYSASQQDTTALPSGETGFSSQTVSMSYSRKINRKLDASVSAGPQWTSNTDSSQKTPTTFSLYASAMISYKTTYTNFSLGYSRGTNSGFGVVAGAESDSLYFTASRTFSKVWNTAFNSTYTRTTSLAVTAGNPLFSPHTLIDSVQISRALARNLSAYASYTLENQPTSGSAVTNNVFSGFYQVASFGLTFSPNLIHLGSQ